jgi:hypothetical protein
MDQSQVAIEATRLAFGMVKDLNVQLLTLGTALIGATVIFSKDVKKDHNWAELILAILLLLFLLASMVFGVISIMKLIGVLAPVYAKPAFTVDAARGATRMQLYSFGFGVILFVLYGIISMLSLPRR